jgi:alkylhydroperoxidase/carboxymuconolactone decarboxylase family protein YurZ
MGQASWSATRSWRTAGRRWCDKNGVKEQELIEAITHLAFYSGWPNAMSCMAVAKELFQAQVSASSEKRGGQQ